MYLNSVKLYKVSEIISNVITKMRDIYYFNKGNKCQRAIIKNVLMDKKGRYIVAHFH